MLSPVPSTRRSAEPGTLNAIREDLRAIREDGGVNQAHDDALIAILAMLAPGAPEVTDDNRQMARNLVLTHVRRVSADADHRAGDDACALAAAESLQTIMTRTAGDDRKVATIRRGTQTSRGCHLSLDGLRKREDVLLVEVAEAVHADLVAALEKRGPQTVEEMARYIIEDVREAWESIDDGLRRLYQVAPMTDSQSRNSIVLSMLYDVAHMQYWFGRMIGIRMRVQQHSRVDLLFADTAAVVMSQAFGQYDDKQTVNQILTEAGRYEKRDFLDRLLDHENGQDIFRRFSEWVSGCHTECAYQRTYSVGLLCPPHQLAFALYMFIDVHEDLLSGALEEDLKVEFNT